MPQRIAVGRIVYGNPEVNVVEPGERFNTEDVGIDAKALARMDEQRIVRKVENVVDAPVAPAGPVRAASEAAPEKLPELVDREPAEVHDKEKSAAPRRHRKDEFDDV